MTFTVRARGGGAVGPGWETTVGAGEALAVAPRSRTAGAGEALAVAPRSSRTADAQLAKNAEKQLRRPPHGECGLTEQKARDFVIVSTSISRILKMS